MESPGLFDPSTDTVGPGASASQLRLQWKQATQAFTETTVRQIMIPVVCSTVSRRSYFDK